MGLTDPYWTARHLIASAHPTLVKRAAIQVVDHLEQVDNRVSGTSPLRILEMLVQIATTGSYIASEEEVDNGAIKVNLHVDDLSPEDKKVLSDFLDELKDVPTSENDESYEDFLERLGIPNTDDSPDDEEDDEGLPTL